MACGKRKRMSPGKLSQYNYVPAYLGVMGMHMFNGTIANQSQNLTQEEFNKFKEQYDGLCLGDKKKVMHFVRKAHHSSGVKVPCPRCLSEETKIERLNNKSIFQPYYQCLKCPRVMRKKQNKPSSGKQKLPRRFRFLMVQGLECANTRSEIAGTYSSSSNSELNGDVFISHPTSLDSETWMASAESSSPAASGERESKKFKLKAGEIPMDEPPFTVEQCNGFDGDVFISHAKDPGETSLSAASAGEISMEKPWDFPAESLLDPCIWPNGDLNVPEDIDWSVLPDLCFELPDLVPEV